MRNTDKRKNSQFSHVTKSLRPFSKYGIIEPEVICYNFDDDVICKQASRVRPWSRLWSQTQLQAGNPLAV